MRPGRRPGSGRRDPRQRRERATCRETVKRCLDKASTATSLTASFSTTALSDTQHSVFWLESPTPEPVQPPLEGTVEADLLVVGGGLTALWTALLAKERDPGRTVALAEAETIAFGASGRNGGFCDASLTHGIANGLARWPDEMPVLERLGRENLDAMEDTVARHGIDAAWERTGMLVVATEPHQVAWLADEAAAARRFGWQASVLDRDAVRAEVR